MLPVVETFVSIQGESTHAGRRCFFIRLAGCNLRCNYCDTQYAWDGGVLTPVDELVSIAMSSNTGLVEVTGGEPLIHEDAPLLMQKLLDAGMEVLLETNGSVSIAGVPEKVRKIVDCKTPGSGMAQSNDFDNFALLMPHDEVKFVISSYDDFQWSLGVIEKYDLPGKTGNLIFSPVWGRVKFEDLADWVVKCDCPVRMQLQMHKLIWGDRKGV